jgi:oxygen-independent coproporphyrinogen-3 oxidase
MTTTVETSIQARPSYSPQRIAAGILGRAALRQRQTKDLLLYIHVPFCTSKCHFCDWVVGYDKADLVDRGELRAQYVEALKIQIRGYAPLLNRMGLRITNLYWGGGTPTRLTPRQMASIFDCLAESVDLTHLAEHTVECSPETVTAEHLDVLRARNLNRASAGAQSFDPAILRKMGRAHSADQIWNAVALFRAAGLNNFNLDLIIGFPSQDRESALASVQAAIDAGVPHLSLYMFREFSEVLISVKQVAAGIIEQSSREERARSYWAAKTLLESHGYEEYIVGYFARSETYYFDCEDFYFSYRGDYFGFGAGATSALGQFGLRSGEGGRYGNSHVRSFIDDPLSMMAVPATHMPDTVCTEGLFKAFTTLEGIDYRRWNDLVGQDFHTFLDSRPGVQKWFEELNSAGACFITDDRGIRLSEETRVSSMMWRR